MIFVNTLGIFFTPLDSLIIDFAENEGEEKAGDDVAEGVHVGHDATGAGETDANNHQEFKDDEGSFVLDVVGKNNSRDEENGSDSHNVGGRPGRLAGTVGTGGKDDEFIKNEIGDGHKDYWKPHPGDFFVNLFDAATFSPLIEAKAQKSDEG